MVTPVSSLAGGCYQKRDFFFSLIVFVDLSIFLFSILHLNYARKMIQPLHAGILGNAVATSLHLSPELHFDRQ